MIVAFLTSDLVFPSRVAGVVQQLGARLEMAATAEALLTKLESAAEEPVVVLLDLGAPQLDPATVVPRLRALCGGLKGVIAFGPHVHDEKLAAAKAAGCDLVLTRGQFSAQMDRAIGQYVHE